MEDINQDGNSEIAGKWNNFRIRDISNLNNWKKNRKGNIYCESYSEVLINNHHLITNKAR